MDHSEQSVQHDHVAEQRRITDSIEDEVLDEIASLGGDVAAAVPGLRLIVGPLVRALERRLVESRLVQIPKEPTAELYDYAQSRETQLAGLGSRAVLMAAHVSTDRETTVQLRLFADGRQLELWTKQLAPDQPFMLPNPFYLRDPGRRRGGKAVLRVSNIGAKARLTVACHVLRL